MIVLYFRQYKMWYLIYILLMLGFFLPFWLYHLPLSYFTMTLLFNLSFLFGAGSVHFYFFRKQMLLLRTFRELDEIAELTSPLDKAYQQALSERERLSAQAIFQSQKQVKNQKAMIQMWAHQMKVPLSAISLMAQTNQLNPADVNQQVLHVERYLENLLTYLKFAHNNDDFRFEEVAVSQLVRQLVKKNRLLFIHKNLSFDCQGDWQLKSDKKWLSFALSQVLDNAIKYTPAGGHIKVRLRDSCLDISDTGIGILPEDLPRLFEEGFTGYNGHEHQKASGFGLYMTKQVLDQLGLSISVASQLDQGTVVTIFKSVD